MISTTSAYARLWIWESVDQKEELGSPAYGHVALETFTGPQNNQATYMSFWTGGHSNKCGDQAHFHHTKAEDDIEEQGKVARSYVLTSLNITKINNAFIAFQSNPHAWGALGWGVLGKAYTRDCCGLTVFLLEKGGIFNSSYSTRYRLNQLIQRAFSGLGCLYSGINLYFSYDLRSRAQQLLEINETFFRIGSYIPQVLKFMLETRQYALGLYELSQEVNSIKQTDVGLHQRAFTAHTTSARAAFKEIEEAVSVLDGDQLDKACFTVQEHISLCQKVSKHLLFASIVTGLGVVILNYVNNRFVSSYYRQRDIRILVERSINAEQAALK